MPFDGLIAKPKFSFLRWWRTSTRQDVEPAIVRPLTVLDKIGLIPVPPEVLARHKAEVDAEFYRKHKIPRSDMYRWFEYFQANSRMLSSQHMESGPTSPLYSNDVLAAVRGLGCQGIGARVIPERVYAIADAATRRANKLGIATERVAGVFYIDPYVSLVYEEDGEVKRACLAIWDGERVLHIAKLT